MENPWNKSQEERLHAIWHGDYSGFNTPRDYSVLSKEELIDEWHRLQIAMNAIWNLHDEMQLADNLVEGNKILIEAKKASAKLLAIHAMDNFKIQDYEKKINNLTHELESLRYYFTYDYDNLEVYSEIVEANLENRFEFGIQEWACENRELMLEEQKKIIEQGGKQTAKQEKA